VDDRLESMVVIAEHQVHPFMELLTGPLSREGTLRHFEAAGICGQGAGEQSLFVEGVYAFVKDAVCAFVMLDVDRPARRIHGLRNHKDPVIIHPPILTLGAGYRINRCG